MLAIYTLSTLIALFQLVVSCPSSEKLSPCYCISTDSSSQITCPDLQNEQTLMDAVYVLRTLSKFYSFTIKNGNFVFIPHDVFKGVKFQELEILSSSFMALTDTDVALEGLEEDLTSLVIKDSITLNEWDWTVLKALKNLVRLHVDVDLEIVSMNIKDISSSSIKDISFANNKITLVEDEAFAGFKQLLSLSLGNNLISEFKRTMMPNPAVLLWKLDLSQNQIQQLPPDLFENMPSLEFLNLNSNQILTLNEKTFEKVWQKLQRFDAMDNQLRCDCRLEWMTHLKFPEHTSGVCDQPMQLRGKKLTELTSKDVWCRK